MFPKSYVGRHVDAVLEKKRKRFGGPRRTAAAEPWYPLAHAGAPATRP